MRSILFALVALFAFPANAEDALTLGSTKGTANYQTAAAIAKIVSYNGRIMTPIPHRGTQAYIDRVDKGEIDFGISNIAQLTWAVRGTVISKRKHSNIRLVANLQTFRTGLLVRHMSGIHSVCDLKGKKVPTEFKSSPMFHKGMIAWLTNCNLTLDDVIQVPVASLGTSWKAFNRGDVSVVIGAIGSGSIKKLHASNPGGVRWLSFDKAGEERMFADYPGYMLGKINPSKATPGIRGGTNVIMFPYTLWAHKDVPDEEVRTVVKYLFWSEKNLKAASPFFKSFDRWKMMAVTNGLPIHPGAVLAYDELDVDIKDRGSIILIKKAEK